LYPTSLVLLLRQASVWVTLVRSSPAVRVLQTRSLLLWKMQALKLFARWPKSALRWQN